MTKPSNKREETGNVETAQWVKDHEDSLDYPDCPDVNRDVEFNISGVSQEVQKAIAKRKAELKK